ncbi:MAG: FGGY family carbohydrate kinase, partial [Actinomycetota bacterium]
MLLGLDVGTTRIKALLVSREGREVPVPPVPTPFVASSGRIEMSVEALRGALIKVLAGLGPARENVAGIGIAGMAESGAPIGESGRPLAPVIAWHDPRGEGTVELLRARLGARLDLSIGQRLRTVSSVAKLGWLIEHGCRGVSRWLGVPELCLWLLTEAEATEHSLVARTGAYDIAARRYLPQVAEVLGVSPAVFAPVGSAGEVLGRVGRERARWWGLPEGVPVTIAGHDHLAGAAGAGARPRDLVNSVGTAETVIGYSSELPDLLRAFEARVAVSIRPGGEGYCLLAGAARAGILIASASAALGATPEALDRLAESAEGAERLDGSEILRSLE